MPLAGLFRTRGNDMLLERTRGNYMLYCSTLADSAPFWKQSTSPGRRGKDIIYSGKVILKVTSFNSAAFVVGQLLGTGEFKDNRARCVAFTVDRNVPLCRSCAGSGIGLNRGFSP